MKTQNKLETDYQNFDFSKADVVEPRLIKKIKQLKSQQTQKPFDDDVIDWLSKQDQTTKHHINEVIRHIMAIQQAESA